MCVLSRFSCVWLVLTSWTVAHQASLFMGFSRQEYWSGLACPPPGIFLTQGLNPSLLWLLLCRQILYHWATRQVHSRVRKCKRNQEHMDQRTEGHKPNFNIKVTNDNRVLKYRTTEKKASVHRGVSCSVVSVCNLGDCTCQAPLSMGFSRPEYWTGSPFPSLGDLPDQGIQLMSPCLLHGKQVLFTHWTTGDRGISKYLNNIFNEEGEGHMISNYSGQTQTGKYSTKQMA